MNKPLPQPILLLIRGIPGSGKSYFAQHLYAALGSNTAILLDPDTTDYSSDAYLRHVQEQQDEGIDPKLYPYRFLRSQAYDGIAHDKIIIWNQPFSNLEILQKVTDRLQEYAVSKSKQLTIHMVEVTIDPTIAQERVKQRVNNGGHGPSEDTFQRFVREYSTAVPLGYNIIPINGLDEPEVTVPVVMHYISSIAA